MRFASFRDSVGIRTQDPQLRRLLLYPTELPNRAKSGCKGKYLYVKNQIYLLRAMDFPMSSMEVTRVRPMRAKRVALP